MRINKIIISYLFIILLIPDFVLAAMSSTNYFIYADSVDFGGGYSTSTNFVSQDSLGGYATGISTSTSYEVRAGLQSAQIGSLSFSLNGSAVDLGTLSNAGTVATANLSAIVNTDSSSGYTLTISAVSGTSLTAVADGSVDGAGGSEEYGLAVSGAHANYADDRAIATNLVLASSTVAVVTDTTTLSFKAVKASGSTAASYSQNITLTVSANL